MRTRTRGNALADIAVTWGWNRVSEARQMPVLLQVDSHETWNYLSGEWNTSMPRREASPTCMGMPLTNVMHCEITQRRKEDATF